MISKADEFLEGSWKVPRAFLEGSWRVPGGCCCRSVALSVSRGLFNTCGTANGKMNSSRRCFGTSAKRACTSRVTRTRL